MDLTGVPTILSFGLIGFAFLMLFLTFLLLKRVVVQGQPAPASVVLCAIFMVIAAAFVGVVAYMEFSKPSVTLHISLHERDWEYGSIEVRRMPGGTWKPLSEAVQQKFADGEEVNISLHEVIKFITLLQAQLQAAHKPALGETAEDRLSREGEGGV